MLRINNVWFRYGKRNWILRGITIDIGEGLNCIVGKNGSGKTTLIRIIIGALKPNRGEIIVYGGKIRDIKDAIGIISYVPSNPTSFLVGPTVREDLEKSSKGELIDIAPIKGLLSKRISDLSEGEKRIVSIYSAILQGNKVIILDEPSVGLDKKHRRLIMEALRNVSKDRIVLIATNDMRIVYECDNVIVLDDGKIKMFGPPLKVILDEDFIFESQIARLIRLLNIGNKGNIEIRTTKELIEAMRKILC